MGGFELLTLYDEVSCKITIELYIQPLIYNTDNLSTSNNKREHVQTKITSNYCPKVKQNPKLSPHN